MFETRSRRSFDVAVAPKRDGLRSGRQPGDMGLCFLTLAKLGQWGRWGSCYPTQAELGWGTPRMALRRVRPARMVRVVLSPTLPTKKTDQVGAIPGLKIETWGTRPIAFSYGENRYEIAAAYGPWKTSGCWWTLEAWDAEEWDVLAVRAESLPSGAKAPIYLADHTARLKSCPDTSCLSDEIFLQSAKSCHDSQPSLSACTASSNSAMIACLLVHDRTRNVWRLEAFYD